MKKILLVDDSALMRSVLSDIINAESSTSKIFFIFSPFLSGESRGQLFLICQKEMEKK